MKVSRFANANPGEGPDAASLHQPPFQRIRRRGRDSMEWHRASHAGRDRLKRVPRDPVTEAPREDHAGDLTPPVLDRLRAAPAPRSPVHSRDRRGDAGPARSRHRSTAAEAWCGSSVHHPRERSMCSPEAAGTVPEHWNGHSARCSAVIRSCRPTAWTGTRNPSMRGLSNSVRQTSRDCQVSRCRTRQSAD